MAARRTSRMLPLLAAMAIVACTESDADSLVDIGQSRGTLTGLVFVDENGTAGPDAQDDGAANVDVALVLAGTTDTVARATTNADGAFTFPAVEVGRYLLVLPGDVLGDSLVVTFRDPPGAPAGSFPLDSAFVDVTAGDSSQAVLGYGYPRVSVAEARALPPGQRVIVRGLALTRVGEFGDTALYLRGDSIAIRASGVSEPEQVFVGDTVHVVGTITEWRGRITLSGARAYIVSYSIGGPTPIDLPARTAASAGGGEYDAELVRVSDLVIADTSRVTPDRLLLRTEDDSDRLEVLIHQDGSFDLSVYAPGARLDVTGVLVPDTTGGRWRLMPRTGGDTQLN